MTTVAATAWRAMPKVLSQTLRLGLPELCRMQRDAAAASFLPPPVRAAALLGLDGR